eukprot:TRINITY_DN15437_c0_g1_i1.p1 TRINITY_DN15437_c0_g1~~TRINITY_DN15437_c0_g1_i1.p1  ORF type:complete len:107 (-),score=0.04 TRINITY_DN15437_c0_g1_i1:56-376(-)
MPNSESIFQSARILLSSCLAGRTNFSKRGNKEVYSEFRLALHGERTNKKETSKAKGDHSPSGSGQLVGRRFYVHPSTVGRPCARIARRISPSNENILFSLFVTVIL